ncbi:MAG TPA: NADP oxidoreductase [Candidatus Lambdaproteobacteria bacterium]|nr:NADP oxidoreductase [Candidatus Lambdaproteobacteria bacterium]HIO60413.1 NADP oxidoreductase [Deltaproteobacteria bacterium]
MNSFWKIAVIGSGPAGFYAAGELFRQQSWDIKVDMFERLPTPFGLVRGGVAPDHQKIKSVTKIYSRIAENENFRFFGNVEFGRDIKQSDLLEHYDAVIYTVGSPADRALGIPGEDLSGSHSATEFVAWYNGHPDFREHKFDLSVKYAFVIGMGNVALDVARILAKNPEELAETDIADYALKALRKSQLEDIWLVGRRGPLQAAFSPVELREFLELPEADVMIEENALELDAESQHILETISGKDTKKNIEILKQMSAMAASGKKRKVHFLFLASPLEISGDGKVEKIRMVRNQLVKKEDGSLRPQATDKIVEEDAGLVFRSIGYHGKPLADLPFDQKSGTIPNECGQVKDPENGNLLRNREYVAGWIKRGPSGVIGTNKQDAVETVHRMLETFLKEKMESGKNVSNPDIVSLLEKRKVEFVSFADWKLLDAHEIEAGQKQGRPRVKLTSIAEMLEIFCQKR